MPFHRREIILGGARFNPLSIPSLQLWLKADAGLTLSVAGFTGTGTTVAQSGNTLTGVATKFLSECVIGDNITGGNGLNGNVTAIASDTSLTLDSSATIGAETPYTITPVAGVSDRVTTWADQSGNGYSPTQAAQTKKPAQKLAVKNGLPVVRFDGQNDTIAKAAPPTVAQGLTIFVVGKLSAAGQVFIDSQNSTEAAFYAAVAQSNYSLFAGSVANTNIAFDTNLNVLCAVVNGATSFVRKNGTQSSNVNPGVSSLTGITIGSVFNGTQALNGDIGEVIIYNSVLSAGNIAAVEAYLNGRFAIY